MKYSQCLFSKKTKTEIKNYQVWLVSAVDGEGTDLGSVIFMIWQFILRNDLGFLTCWGNPEIPGAVGMEFGM